MSKLWNIFCHSLWSVFATVFACLGLRSLIKRFCERQNKGEILTVLLAPHPHGRSQILNKMSKCDILTRQVTETACCSTGNSEHALFWPFIALQVFDRCASLLGYFVHVHFTHYVNWPVALSVFGRGLLAVLLDLMVIIAQYNIEICFWIIKVSNHIKVKCWFWL